MVVVCAAPAPACGQAGLRQRLPRRTAAVQGTVDHPHGRRLLTPRTPHHTTPHTSLIHLTTLLPRSTSPTPQLPPAPFRRLLCACAATAQVHPALHRVSRAPHPPLLSPPRVAALLTWSMVATELRERLRMRWWPSLSSSAQLCSSAQLLLLLLCACRKQKESGADVVTGSRYSPNAQHSAHRTPCTAPTALHRTQPHWTELS